MVVENKDSTIYSLNWLRGIASLMVCLYHFKGFVWANQNDHFFLKALNQGYLGVYIFFIISGFVIPYSLQVKNYKLPNFPKFFLKRMCRIEPPFIICLIMILAWRYYANVHFWERDYTIDIKQFFLNITYLAPFFKVEWVNVIFWTLAIEFQFYILTGLLFPLMMQSSKNKYLIFAAVLAIGFCIPKKFETIFNFYIYFIIGFQTFQFFIKQMKWKEYGISLIVSFLFIFINEKDPQALIPISIFTIFGIFTFNFKHQIGVFFGDISYSLYLTHGLAGGSFYAIIQPSLPDFFKFLVLLFVGISFAFMYYSIIEKVFLKLSKKIKYEKNNLQ